MQAMELPAPCAWTPQHTAWKVVLAGLHCSLRGELHCFQWQQGQRGGDALLWSRSSSSSSSSTRAEQARLRCHLLRRGHWRPAVTRCVYRRRRRNEEEEEEMIEVPAEDWQQRSQLCRAIGEAARLGFVEDAQRVLAGVRPPLLWDMDVMTWKLAFFVSACVEAGWQWGVEQVQQAVTEMMGGEEALMARSVLRCLVAAAHVPAPAALRWVEHFARWGQLQARDSLAAKGYIVDNVADGATPEVLAWLTAHGAKASTRAMDKAAEFGNLAALEWLHASRAEGCSPRAMGLALRNEQLPVVIWLLETGVLPCPENAMQTALQAGSLRAMEFLHVRQLGQLRPEDLRDPEAFLRDVARHWRNLPRGQTQRLYAYVRAHARALNS